MKNSTKKLLYYSLSVLITLSLLIWYFFPVLLYKFVYSRDKLQEQLSMSPKYVEDLLVPPKEWNNITISELTLKVPLFRYKKLNGFENQISFVSEEGTFLIFDVGPTKELLKVIEENEFQYPFPSFQTKLDIVKSLPSDISMFNARRKNKQGLTNQTLKAISIPPGGLGEVLVFNLEVLKAVCIISENEDNDGYSAIVDIYSSNEAMSLDLILGHYKDKTTLQRDILTILGGIRVPDHLIDSEAVKKDIEGIVKKYNKT